VPAGFVAVVVDVTAFLDGDLGASAECYIEDPNSWLAFWASSTEGAQWYQWRGRIVCQEGETLACDCTATGSCSIVACGYLLSA
jgi:hypothetical protein